MKRSIIALATGLLFSSLSMAMTNANAASDAPRMLPCGKWSTPQNQRLSNFGPNDPTNYYNALAKNTTGSPAGRLGRSAN